MCNAERSLLILVIDLFLLGLLLVVLDSSLSLCYLCSLQHMFDGLSLASSVSVVMPGPARGAQVDGLPGSAQ